MERRKFILAIGGIASTGAAVGSGAFTSVEATRDVSVSVADDTNAYLAMEPLDSPNGNQFASTDGDVIALDFSQSGNNGSGLGTNSIYNFDKVFQIANQGTQGVYVWAKFSSPTGDFDIGSPDTDIWLYPNGDPDDKLRDSEDDVLYLPTGSSVDIGVYVDTDDLDVDDDQELTMTVRADVNNPTAGDVVGGGGTTVAEPTDGLVSYWPLDDVESGTASDAVGTNDGTVIGDVSAASGERPGANFPPGSGDYVDVGDGSDFAFENFTVSAWARAADGDRGLRTIVARQDETASNPYEKRTFILWFDDNDSNFGAEVITGRTSESDGDLRDVTASDEDYVDDEWHHIAMTVAADDRISLYVDGDHKGTDLIDGSPYTGSAETWVGLEPGQARPLAGDVGDLRIYDRVLSSGEIGDLASNTE
ncbi:LamG domain-containing protein [Halorubrum halophilum]|uniref:LamG domain-containing protein n=1 Tax=Halorubrum halophilum TaxID=413816 RepID=UPI000678B887|nr:LamG domain-containing protein [Halorubrum halophilum]